MLPGRASQALPESRGPQEPAGLLGLRVLLVRELPEQQALQGYKVPQELTVQAVLLELAAMALQELQASKGQPVPALQVQQE